MSRMSDSERLILEVEKRPCLWQTTSEDYSKRELKDKAWEDVCRELYPQCDEYFEIQKQVADMKKKWVNIRAYYRKEMLTRRENQTSNIKRKKYVFADILRFLDPVLDHKDFDENDDNYLDENEINVTDKDENNSTIILPKDKIPRKCFIQMHTKTQKPAIMKNSLKGIKSVRKSEKTDIDTFSHLLNNIQNMKTEEQDEEEEEQEIASNAAVIRKNKRIKRNFLFNNDKTIEMEILNILKTMQTQQSSSTSSFFTPYSHQHPKQQQQQQQQQKESSSTDPDTSFLLSLVPDVKSLTDMQKIQFKTGIFLLLNQLKFSNSNLNFHTQSASTAIPSFTKSQFSFPFYTPWSHYIQEAQKDTVAAAAAAVINNVTPSALNVSPPLPGSSTESVSINSTSLYGRDTNSGFSPCTSMSKNYH